ncbi:right-handed parallel beta-helix repeat-containing protein [Couchioplanes azureus]|uniref:hypothetical protein n=1 Tax=Couchioplanes caeruleus TaxID=56438 RepID=UPI00166F9E7F|nr:hypothetical protein [Couchioplanes caeruleus]GGQ74890.1 hypothetical protein GCM10010166_51040 [Couchioplanes caeruleus subsp. azureus]
MTYRPRLTADAAGNRRIVQELLDTARPGILELPPGDHPVAGGLAVPQGWSIRGAAGSEGRPASWLVSADSTDHPLVHVLGSGVSVRDLGLRPASADPGEHGGDRGTALTVGRYLYAAPPQWITGVEVRRVHVERPGDRHANGIALMGAVRDVALEDVTVRGGHTALAVHWGAVGADVSSVAGPTFHPHRLDITGLRVRDAVEGFYLSSVHDVRVVGCCLRDVEMGFRLLPGDNTDRYVTSARIGAGIEIARACVAWTGPRYAVRVAGWGRSEVDGAVTVLRYADTVIRDCRLSGTGTAGTWSPVLVEQAPQVQLRNIRIDSDAPSPGRPCCELGLPA